MKNKLNVFAGLSLLWLCAVGANGAHAAETVVKPGMKAPAFTLPSQKNTPVSLSDFKEKWVVLYFYPRDKSTGCTIEAHAFQNDLSKFEARNAVVLGVSLDTVESHKSFCTQDGLTFKLLADPERIVASEYGVPEMTFNNVKYDERDTILIAPNGKIARVWRKVDAEKDSTLVLAEIAKLQSLSRR
jgi:thioredoxin-dependent peroxiredoxin